jgi:thiamine biosynthesis lipoprotein
VKAAVQFSEHFRAMGTDIDVIIEAEERPLDGFIAVRLLFEQQEERFSRFRAGSLVSRLNAGETVADPWLTAVLELSLEAFGQTGGLFNPMILPALTRAGYDRDFADVSGGAAVREPAPDASACIERAGDGWRLTQGAIDLGGIVKGWTADLAVEHLAGRYGGVFVNAGGDIRCAGSEEGSSGWIVDVDGPGGSAAWAGMIPGAIATSSVLKRRWRSASGGVAHHLIDPRTGMPAESPFVQVSVRAGSCTWAEVWAKAVLIGGHAGLDLARAYGLPVLALAADGSRTVSGEW